MNERRNSPDGASRPSGDITASESRRIEIACMCHDCDIIPKVADAGVVDGDVQVMHNGVKVAAGGYYGAWTTELLRRLKGHHEPQEEVVFWEVLKRIPAGATMIEMGGFWAYYSLWFNASVKDARNIICEPDPAHFDVGKKNFQLNARHAEFLPMCVGERSGTVPFHFEGGGQSLVECVSIDDLVRRLSIPFVDLLHLDVQGAELAALRGAADVIAARNVRFVFISTHHHCISNDPIIHHKCLAFLIERGAHLISEHRVCESFSGDGLIVASFDDQDKGFSVPVSLNRAKDSLFGEVEFDLDELAHPTLRHSLSLLAGSVSRKLKRLWGRK